MSHIDEIEKEIIYEQDGWYHNLSHFQLPNTDYSAYLNDEDDDKFIVTRLASGRFSWKPNLRSRRFLFRGQNRDYGQIRSSFARQSDFKSCILSNIKVKEFTTLVRSHPLFIMFERGIVLEPYNVPFFFEMNYYGLAQHYGFNTGLVDFSSDVWTSAFFAVTKCENGIYEPIIDVLEYPYGVLYLHEIKPLLSFTNWGLRYSTIGLQVYPRSGRQKGFLWNEEAKDPSVTPLYFRHDPTCSSMIFEGQGKGKRLFPKDDIEELANDILSSKSVSGIAFAENLYLNPGDDARRNCSLLQDNGISIDWNRKQIFTREHLHDFYQDIKNGLWESFCSQIAFVGSNGSKLLESLKQLESNPYYSHFFKEAEFDRLQYFNLGERESSLFNPHVNLGK